MFLYVIKILVFIPIVIFLIVISLKMSQKTLLGSYKNKYIRVLEVLNISKNNSIIVLKIGESGCVVSSTPSGVEKLKDLTEEDVLKIDQNLKENSDINFKNFNLKNEFGKYFEKIVKKED
ncbi:flagellar biosynthetic protein FliO [Metaclostridioides mangenotii]|uniref:flagellar biosynthetic protein FliO n=1 Tax=Metaclostridioides mangenotii TaxID=1540 RepID=UPI000463CF0B|nr:flagellar biosynthetic protein FliO [Clostridioides mangenotii]